MMEMMSATVTAISTSVASRSSVKCGGSAKISSPDESEPENLPLSVPFLRLEY